MGYRRSLSAEGLLSLKPSLLLATPDAGPPQVLEQLRGAGLDLRVLPVSLTPAAVADKIRAVAAALGREAQGEALIRAMQADLAAAERRLAAVSRQPRVLFLLHTGQGSGMASGCSTSADALIRLAGGLNVMAEAFAGYNPLSAEAVIAAAPELILLTERNLEQLGGAEGVLEQPGLAETPAGKAGRLVTIPGIHVVGMGPRLGQAVLGLIDQFHPGLP